MIGLVVPRVIYVDVRPLQDPHYRFRGVGQHSTSLLTALSQHQWEGQKPQLVALSDHGMELLHEEHKRLFDVVQTGVWFPTEKNSWFVTLSPMTHDPIKAEAFLSDSNIFKIALFYDLIQFKFPERYLSNPISRIEFLIAFAWLDHYDVFASISRDSGDDLIKFRAIDPSKIFVSGVAVRSTLEPQDSEKPLPRSARSHILVAGGGDPRKNPECVLIAHARSRQSSVRDLPVIVFGNYPSQLKDELLALFVDEGGDAARLTFPQHLQDEELRTLYRNAVLTVVPSRAEGFSIPIIESSAAGTPVAASVVGAHGELISDKQLQFEPDDFETLGNIMDRLVCDEAEWSRCLEEITPLWKACTTQSVGRRFMEGVLARQLIETPRSAPAVSRGARPQLAVLTPLPPSQSGVADYSEATLAPLAQYADLHLFTDSKGAMPKNIYSSMGSVSMAPFSAKQFDQRLSVLGNSHFHLSIFNYLMEYGGAALAHDARMINFYAEQFGHSRARELARKEWRRDISVDLLNYWLENQNDMPVLFLSEIAKIASPMIVHSPVTAMEIEKLYAVKPKVLPFAQYRPVQLELFTLEQRRKHRAELEWLDDEIVITSFGFVSPDKAPELLIWSLKMLRSWNVNARLVFCGLIGDDVSSGLRKLVADVGIEDAVSFFPGRVSEQTYLDHLVATDAAIQLRTYFMGGLSGALNDCIAAAVPTVSNEHLALASGAPSFVRRVPDRPTPQQVAEALLEIIGTGHHRDRPLEEARSFADAHSPLKYAAQMMEALGFDVAQ